MMTAIATRHRKGLMGPEHVKDILSLQDAVDALRTGTGIYTTTSITAKAGDVIWCNTAGGAITITLPSGPAAFSRIVIIREGANSVIIARNGQTITGIADDLTINRDKRGVNMNFVNGTWKGVGMRNA